MAVAHTSLSFEATDQSLWAPGTAADLSVDTGDAMVFDPPEATWDFEFEELGFGIYGQAYIDFKIGLIAHAELPSAGSFDVSFGIDLNVLHPAGIDTDITSTMAFDFGSWSYGSAEISSEAFSGSPEAGLDLVVALDAGVRGLGYETPFGGDSIGSFELISFDETIPLITLSLDVVSFELELGDYLTLKGELPSGAETEGESQGVGVVEASGESEDSFLSLEADLDKLLVDFLQLIPVAGQVIKAVGEVIFAEHSFDLHDFLPFVPADKVVLEATVLDIGASAGAVITEEVGVDIGGADNIPDVAITLRSDNGTPDDYSDDVIASGFLGDVIVLPCPTPPPGLETGTATVTAYYDLQDCTFSHGVGLGITAAFTITALKAELGGDWVPGFLSAEFGPVKELTFPEDGFTIELGNLYEDAFTMESGGFGNAASGTDPSTWNYTEGAFGQIIESYEVFYTDTAPPGWNPDALGAKQAIADFREALIANLEATILATGQLWGNDGRALQTLDDGPTNLAFDATDTTLVWQGNANTTASIPDDPYPIAASNFIIVAPETKFTPVSALRANILMEDGSYLFHSSADAAIGADASAADLSLLLHSVASGILGLAEKLVVAYGAGATLRTLETPSSPEIIGRAGGDLLVHFGNTAQYFDGGGENLGDHDVFVADLRNTDGFKNAAISWDLYDAVTNDVSVSLGTASMSANYINVKNVEAMFLITGDANDDIKTYWYSDRVETSGGDDFIRNVGDDEVDTILAGADDDLIVTNVAGLPSPRAQPVVDSISGGTGQDLAIHYQQTAEGMRVDVIGDGALTFGGDGIGAFANVADLVTLMQANTTYFIDATGATAQLDRDGGNDAVVLINNSYEQGATRYSGDIEGISVIASDIAEDLVLFAGGLTYIGGTGLDSNYDTLVADFGAYETVLGFTSGLNLVARGDPTTIGDTYIEGFERLAVFGTSFDDRIEGNTYADVISGETGNDVVYGGDDVARDYLAGGAGSDFFTWNNDGADVIRGDAGFHAAGDAADSDSLSIAADLYATHGLIYDIQQMTSTDQALAGVRGIDVHGYGFFSSSYSALLLLDALYLTLHADANGQVRAVSFDGYENEDFMSYSGIEKTNIRGSDAWSDLMIYENGASYVGGESAEDSDTFVADFSAQHIGLNFQITDEDTTGTLLENGVFVNGVDRAVLRAGQGNDRLLGGRWDDWFHGGDGADTLWGAGGDDELIGGDGGDIVYWFSDGNDSAHGGLGVDNLVIAGGSDGMGVRLEYSIGQSVYTTDLVTASSSESSAVQLLDALDATASVDIREVHSGSQVLIHNDFESVTQFGQSEYDDFILFQGGLSYTGGETAGDGDVFAGNFSSSTQEFVIDVNRLDLYGEPDFYNIGNGTYIGEFERLFLRLGGGNDSIDGGALADYVDGGAGNDHLQSGIGGDDHLLGGSGDDVLGYSNSNGYATLEGGEGYDIVNAGPAQGGLYGALTLTLQDADGNALGDTLFATLAADHAVLTDFFNVQLPLATSFSYLDTSGNGTSGGFTLSGFEQVNITGDATADVLMSGSTGGRLYGADGEDLLIARGGLDVLIGGYGFDSYAFDTYSGPDVICGETGTSVLYFINQSKDDLAFQADGDDLIVISLGSTVTITGYFAGGGNGLDFIFDTTDYHGTLDLSGLGATGGGSVLFGETVYATDADDALDSPSDDNDVIFGRDGSDLIRGGPGADIIDGGGGEDMVSYANSVQGVVVDLLTQRNSSGDAEDDVLLNIEHVVGGQGENTLSGDDQGNTLIGDDLTDTIYGRAGNDFLIGSGGNDFVSGDAGSDLVFGDDGDDNISGDDDDDFVSGGTGNDLLWGGAGTDVLNGGAGNDTIYGEAGDDTMVFGGTEDTLTSGVFEDGDDSFGGGAGLDTADFSQFGSAISASLIKTLNTVQTRDGFNLDVATGTLRSIANLGDVEDLVGSAFDDLLVGNASVNGLYGGSGDDVLRGNNGGDLLVGGSGTDTADYSNENGGFKSIQVNLDAPVQTAVDSWNGTDTLSGIENIIGTAYVDDILMDGADNAVIAGGGADSVSGGAGNDTLNGGVGPDTLAGGEGFDTVSYAGAAAGVSINLALGTATGGVANGDQISGFENLIGGNGNDTLKGTATGNFLIGGSGSDVFAGNAGDDTLEGGAGADTLGGGAGIDTIVYLGSALGVAINLATLKASGGEATGDKLSAIENVVGGSGNDTVGGSAAANVLVGGAGNDTLTGAGGNDAINGGTGGDRLIGGFGIDTLSYAGSSDGVQIDLATNTATGGDAAGDVIGGFENLAGSSGDDRLSGNAVANAILGGGGDDTLAGGAGADTLVGGSGVDELSYATAAQGIFVSLASSSVTNGDAAGDVISGFENFQGGLDDDVVGGSAVGNELIGGAGIDAIAGLGGDDTINGGAGADLLDGGDGRDTLDYTASTLGVIIDLAASTAAGGDAAGDQIANFENVTGSSQADNLVGGELAESFDAGAGNDTVLGGGGADTLAGGGDIDRLSYASSTAAVSVSLATSEASGGDADGDTISGFEQLTGSSQADTLTGDGDANRLDGGAGNDTLVGGGGADALVGGTGIDTLNYSLSTLGVSVSLGANTASGGDASGDSILGVENLGGSASGDLLIGNGVANRIDGSAGNDTIRGGAGVDTLIGGAGADTLSYAGSAAGVTVNLATNAVSGGDAVGDQVSSFASFLGSSHNDSISGSTGANSIAGGNGNDTLRGGAGVDAFVFDTPLAAATNVDAIKDFVHGIDTLQLDVYVFTVFATAGLTAAKFYAHAGASTAHDLSDRIIYNTTTGALFYDADGSASGSSAIKFAVLGAGTHPTLSISDFVFVG